MCNDLQEKSDNYWQNEAKAFVEQYKTSIFSFSYITKRLLDKRTRWISSLLDTTGNESLIDIGCGSGIHLVELDGKFSKMVGVDYSLQMLNLCRQKLKCLINDKVNLVNCSADNLSIGNDRFDWVLSLGLLDYLPDYRLGLKEFHRILKPHGKAIFTLPKKPSIFFFFRSSIGISLRKTLFNLPPILNIVTKQELVSAIESVGFSVLFIEPLWTTMWVVKIKKIH